MSNDQTTPDTASIAPPVEATPAASDTDTADRRAMMARMGKLLAAAPVAALLFDPRRAEASAIGSFE